MRKLPSLLVALLFVLMLLPTSTRAAAAATRAYGVGSTQLVAGWAVHLVAAQRTRQAGLAGYVPAKGNIFLMVTVQVTRKGSHDTYVLDPSDFSIQTSQGGVIDSEEFGIKGELTARHVYSKTVHGVIGFEVPANDKHLQLLWQPTLPSAPDTQLTWQIGGAGPMVAAIN